jgi:hypothetical protein
LPAAVVSSQRADPVVDCLRDLQEGLEDLLVLGLQRSDGQVVRRWRDLQHCAEGTGLVRLAVPVRQLADSLEQKTHTLRWDWQPAARSLLQVAVLLRLTRDILA